MEGRKISYFIYIIYLLFRRKFSSLNAESWNYYFLRRAPANQFAVMSYWKRDFSSVLMTVSRNWTWVTIDWRPSSALTSPVWPPHLHTMLIPVQFFSNEIVNIWNKGRPQIEFYCKQRASAKQELVEHLSMIGSCRCAEEQKLTSCDMKMTSSNFLATLMSCYCTRLRCLAETNYINGKL